MARIFLLQVSREMVKINFSDSLKNILGDRAFEIAKHSINASAIAQNFDTALEDLAATTGFKPETITQDGKLTLKLQDTVNAIIKY